MSKLALVTGATAGIGEATAEVFAANGWNLIITGRRAERLENIAQSLTKQYSINVLPLAFDVRNYEEVTSHLNGMGDEWKKVDVLVNNAGLAAGKDPIQKGKLDHWERMIDTNIKGLLYVTKTVVPWMLKVQKGHIINVGSIAGKEVYQNGNVYCATKHAVDALSRGMRLDLVSDNIKVTNIAPGLVETEFSIVRHDGDKTLADATYDGFTPLVGKDIADCILFAATRPAHVNVGDMLILPTAQANATTIKRD